MTKDFEFEDECLKLIFAREFNEAYKMICKFKMERNILDNIDRQNYRKKYETGLNHNQLTLYSLFFNADISSMIPEQFLENIVTIKLCIIFGDMMGEVIDKIIYLITRLAPDIKKSSMLLLQYKIFNLN